MGVRIQLNTAATNKIAACALIHWATAQIIIYLLHGQQRESLNTLQLSAHGVVGAAVGPRLYATGGEGGPASVAVLQARAVAVVCRAAMFKKRDKQDDAGNTATASAPISARQTYNPL